MNALTLIVVLPLAGFVLNGVLGNRLGKPFVTVVGCGLPVLSFLVTVRCFLDLQVGGAPVIETAYAWAQVGGRSFDVPLLRRGAGQV